MAKGNAGKKGVNPFVAKEKSGKSKEDDSEMKGGKGKKGKK